MCCVYIFLCADELARPQSRVCVARASPLRFIHITARSVVVYIYMTQTSTIRHSKLVYIFVIPLHSFAANIYIYTSRTLEVFGRSRRHHQLRTASMFFLWELVWRELMESFRKKICVDYCRIYAHRVGWNTRQKKFS